MEDSSHELIEQLMSKEKYCFDNANVLADNINSVREPLSPHPTIYSTNKDDVVSSLDISSEKELIDKASKLTPPVSTEDSEFDVANGAYKTPLTTPLTTPSLSCSNTSNNTLDEAHGIIQLNASSPSQNITSTETKIVATETNVSDETVKSDTTLEENKFVINLEEISDHERSHCSEWFLGKPAKTPERYMRIRNHILDCWKKMKPNYLTKTAGRRNLSSCGDVNAVGRIHAYLESIDAINVDCAKPMKRVYGKSASSDDRSPVKKVKKTPGFIWEEVDDEIDDTKTNESVIIKSNGKKRPQRTVKKPEAFYSESSISGYSNDPFTLVPVNFYKADRNAPFTVSITSESLLVMDFHAHLAYTEIIGLLGGRVVENAESGVQELKIEYVFPCRSTSTGIQCEMDPVSEMKARELFEEKGLSVVGWYHSHPTFEPEPSIRDIENQASYQELFRQPSGLEPFIGIIITPYNSRDIVTVKSQIQIIHISQILESKGAYRLPFACLHRIIPSKSISEDVVSTLKQLVADYKDHEHKIDMTLQYGQILRLDKLINTMKNHLFMDEQNVESFLSDLKDWIQNF